MYFILQLIGIFIIFGILGLLERFFRQPNYHKSSHKPVATNYFKQGSRSATAPNITIELTPNYMYISAQEKRDYLSSHAWHTLRTKALERADYKCQTCGTSSSLQCHHIRYDWLSEGGDNELEDLAILCHSCHQELHDQLGYDRATTYNIK